MASERPYVLHWRDRHLYSAADTVYIGRANRRAGIPHDSPLANPFVIGKDGDRAEVIAKYRDYLPGQEWLIKLLPQLRGRVLLCWCKPREGFCGRLLCHGQIVAGLLYGIPPEEVE